MLQIYKSPLRDFASPFILGATLQYHFLQNNPQFHKNHSQHIYVDNLITSVQHSSEAIQLFHTANELFDKVSLQLAQWASNDVQGRELFPTELAIQNSPKKLLGLYWDFKKDTLYLRDRTSIPKSFMKRTILQSMSLLYNRIGWFQPLLIFIKTLWELKRGWDSEIPQNLLPTAQTILAELQHCPEVKWPRQ